MSEEGGITGAFAALGVGVSLLVVAVLFTVGVKVYRQMKATQQQHSRLTDSTPMQSLPPPAGYYTNPTELT